MSLLDSLFLDSAIIEVWVSPRADSLRGSDRAADPWNGGVHYGNASRITLARGGAWPDDFEATATTSTPHGLADGDLVEIAGAENNTTVWNGLFGVYAVTDFTFKYFMKARPTVSNASAASFRHGSLLFDEVTRQLPEEYQSTSRSWHFSHARICSQRFSRMDAPDPRYKGLHEVVALTPSAFTFKLPDGTPALPSGLSTYGIACGIDFLVIENNQIQLMDLDEDYAQYRLGRRADPGLDWRYRRLLPPTGVGHRRHVYPEHVP